MTMGVLKELGGPRKFPWTGHRPLTPDHWSYLRLAHRAPPRIWVQGTGTSSLGKFSGVPLRSPFSTSTVLGDLMG